MTQDDIFDEIQSVFRGPMDGSNTFLFDVLQPAGDHSKSLTIPLYILAKESLNKVSIMDVHVPIQREPNSKWKNHHVQNEHTYTYTYCSGHVRLYKLNLQSSAKLLILSTKIEPLETFPLYGTYVTMGIVQLLLG